MTRRHLSILLILVSLAGCARDSGPQPQAQAPTAATSISFADGTAASGVDFLHVPSRSADKWMPETMGSGLVIADFNRDGAPDMVLVNGGAFGSPRPANAQDRLYINDGRGKFSDRTSEWNLTSTGYGMGAAAADYDGDGWTDLFVTNYEGDNRLFRNVDGKSFEDTTEKAGLRSDGKWATSAGFGDLDGDGDLDLFIVRYVEYDKTATKTYRNRILIYPTPISFDAVPDQLWRNDGNGHFSDVTAASGLVDKTGKGLALALGDIDLDGDLDIFVANDTSANAMWLNDGKGVFKDMAALSGTAYSSTGREEGSMGADMSDLDANDRLDITVTNFQDENASIYSQIQPMLFQEVSDAVGVGVNSRSRLKFGVDLFDADNDGDEDLIIANGHIEDNIEQNSDTVTFAQQNSLFENRGLGKFVDISNSGGPALLDKKVSRGLATADLDGDGDLDAVISNNGDKAQIAVNESSKKGNFTILWLEGSRNKSAIGTRIVARVGGRMIHRQVMGAQSYLSMSDLRLHLGVGDAAAIDELTIFWAGGKQQSVSSLETGKFYFIREGEPPVAFIPGEKQIL